MTANEGFVTSAGATERSPLLENGIRHVDDAAVGGTADDISAEDDEVPLAHEPTTGEMTIIMLGPWLGSFLAAVDATIIATLSAPISASFNSLSMLSWLGSAYFIANAGFQPLSGRLTDIISRRWGLVISTILFGAGNLICGLAQDEWVMILGRVVAGSGGGCLNAISTFIGSDMVPLRRRGIWQGIGNIMYGTGAAVGAVIGGWINDVWGWRAAFFILVPLSALSGFLCFWNINVPVKHSKESALRRIDFQGAICLLVSLVLLLLGINSGGNVVPWNHPLVYVSIPVSAFFIGIFAYIELYHASEPIIPVRLLGDRTVLTACLTNWFASMAIFSIMYYAPIYFQVKGLSTTEAGLRLAPQSVGTALGSIAVGLAIKGTGRYYYLGAAVLSIFVASNALLCTFQLDSPLWLTLITIFLAGVGFVGMLTVTLLAFIAAVDHKYQAVITSASYAFRSTGSAIGIAVSSAVFQNVLGRRLHFLLDSRKDGSSLIHALRESLDAIRKLPPDLKGSVQAAYMESIRGVFFTTLGLSVAAGLTILLMREHTLYTNLSRK